MERRHEGAGGQGYYGLLARSGTVVRIQDLPVKGGPRTPDKATLVYTVEAGGRSGATSGPDEALKETLKLPLVLFVPGPGPPERTEAERREVWQALEKGLGARVRMVEAVPPEEEPETMVRSWFSLQAR